MASIVRVYEGVRIRLLEAEREVELGEKAYWRAWITSWRPSDILPGPGIGGDMKGHGDEDGNERYIYSTCSALKIYVLLIWNQSPRRRCLDDHSDFNPWCSFGIMPLYPCYVD